MLAASEDASELCELLVDSFLEEEPELTTSQVATRGVKRMIQFSSKNPHGT